TIPLVVVYSNIVYKRLVLGEEKLRSFKDGGLDSSYVMDNIASSRPAGSRGSSDMTAYYSESPGNKRD
ncbi:hypothetical protein GGF37_007456, partial [Kickxella alabastrina]